jgi:hypothetical protein
MEIQLTDRQTEQIWLDLSAEGMRDTRLKAEVLDHFCCRIEELMTEGLSFDQAYQMARTAITPQGAGDIQAEDQFMIALSKQKPMKQFFYLSAFLATFLLMSGFLFRTMHHALGGAVLLAGHACLLFGVLPAVMVFFVRHLRYHTAADKVRVLAGVAGGAMFGVGSIFKILHYPLASILSISGLSLLILLFLPLFFWHLYRRAV